MVAALGAATVGVEGDAAERAAVEREVAWELLRGGIDTTGEGQTDDVQFVFQEVVDYLDHSLDGHGLFRHNQATFGVGLAEFGLESRTAHFVLWCTMANTGFLVHIEDGRQEWVIVTEDKGMVEILQNRPCGFLDLVSNNVLGG